MDIEIRRLTPDLAEEYVRFFDVTPHNDEFGHKCYCVSWRSDDSYTDDCGHWFPTQEERREKALQFVKDSSIQGYLAYCDGRVLGWCNANENSRVCLAIQTYWKWPVEEYPAGVKVKSIFCFVIAPEMQRKGVATKLLERVCQDAAAEGFDYVEAYTTIKFAHDGFQGPFALYQKCGFSKHAKKKDKIVMRRALK
ncbi:MAG: GNAT family N-acetyltransferase [Oscillospiraceae bacterium]|nr:GNAT family N-acetyltransferase [Oscillospiraceae bacterium]